MWLTSEINLIIVSLFNFSRTLTGCDGFRRSGMINLLAGPLLLDRVALLHGEAVATCVMVSLREALLEISFLDHFDILDKEWSECFIVKMPDFILQIKAASL